MHARAGERMRIREYISQKSKPNYNSRNGCLSRIDLLDSQTTLKWTYFTNLSLLFNKIMNKDNKKGTFRDNASWNFHPRQNNVNSKLGER